MKTAYRYFIDGMDARRAGLTEHANPLNFKGAWPFQAWEAGYNFAIIHEQSNKPFEGHLEEVPANPFWQGWNSRIKGVFYHDGPYERGTAAASDWEKGWMECDQDQRNKMGSHLIAQLTLIGVASILGVLIGLLMWVWL